MNEKSLYNPVTRTEAPAEKWARCAPKRPPKDGEYFSTNGDDHRILYWRYDAGTEAWRLATTRDATQ